MTYKAEQWPSREGWEEKVERDWQGKREIPLLGKLIKDAASLRFDKSFENKEIAQAIGMTPTHYSNCIKDNLCTFDFLIKISRWVDIPIHVFAQVSDLSIDYEKKYSRDSVAVLRDFKNEARRFLDGSDSAYAYEKLLNEPGSYEPRDSAVASIDVHLCDEAGHPVPSARGARRLDLAGFYADHAFHAGDRFEILVRGKPGWNVILLESQVIPYRLPDWGMLNGALPGKRTLVGACLQGIYRFEGIFGPPAGCYRISAAILSPGRDILPWETIQAGDKCPAYLLEQLSDAASADEKQCFLTTFTYELLPS